MGIPSVGILLHEVIKLMYHARVKDPVFFRLGTCGGIGLDGGQLVITDEAVDGMMRPFLELVNYIHTVFLFEIPNSSILHIPAGFGENGSTAS